MKYGCVRYRNRASEAKKIFFESIQAGPSYIQSQSVDQYMICLKIYSKLVVFFVFVTRCVKPAGTLLELKRILSIIVLEAYGNVSVTCVWESRANELFQSQDGDFRGRGLFFISLPHSANPGSGNC